MFDFQAFPTLETPRLILREIMPADADAIFRIRSDYAVTRLNIGPSYETVREAEDLIESMTRRYQERSEIRWGIIVQTEPEAGVIGMCGYNSWNQIDRRGSIGFDLARAFWNRGFGTEAIREIIRFGFTEMRLNRIEADASVENLASIRLLQKLGFQHEGTQRDQYFDENDFHDLELFGLLRRDWPGVC